jgi:glycosyltransferase involved in cell wall biosynthesis
MTVVGIQRNEYPERRNITFIQNSAVEFRIVGSDFDASPPFVTDNLSKSKFFREYAFHPSTSHGIDCFHFFNSIPVIELPFVTTFETSLPRWWGIDLPAYKEGLRILSTNSCRRILAISRNAIEIFHSSIQTFAPELSNVLLQKTELLYPPQPVTSVDDQKYQIADSVHFGFIGTDFLRKGALELLLALERAIKSRAKVKLTLVAEFRVHSNDRPYDIGGAARLDQGRQVLGRLMDHVIHYPRVDNKRALEILSTCHVGLLPSFSDTFGYSVLEAQSALCSTVTTNIRAFPEINTPDCGWMVNLPLNRNRDLDLGGATFEVISENLVTQLYNIFMEISGTSLNDLREKAENALSRIQQVHDPHSAADRICTLYQQ